MSGTPRPQRLAAALACAAAAWVNASACRDRSRAEPQPVRAPAPTDAAASPGLERERIAVTGVEVRVLDPSRGPAREVYPRVLAQRFGATLTESEWFLGGDAPAPDGLVRAPARVELDVGYDEVPEGTDGRPAVLAVVEARIAWQGGAPRLAPAIHVLAERGYAPAEAANLDGLTAAHVERAVADAARGLIAKERIRVGPLAEALGALTDRDPELQIWALSVVAERRLRDAADAVIALLGSEQDAVRDAAIGALVALRERRAVAPLTRMAEFQDYGLVRRVIDAVGALGGAEAREYLEFVASGHPDDEIRAQAADALRRLQRTDGG
jgi:hypothetical protein